MKRINNAKNLNKKFIVTALGVAALGFQLMQTNNVKAADVKADTDSNTEQASDTQTKVSSVADSTPLKSVSTINSDNSGTESNNNANAEQEQSSDTNAGESSKNADSQEKVADLSKTDSPVTNDSENSADDSTTETKSNTNNDKTTTNEESKTPTDSQADNTVTSTDPALIDETPAGSEANVDTTNDPIQSNIKITATNSNGTVSSTSTATKGASAVINSDSTSANIVLTITNTSDEKQDDYGETIRLPKHFQDAQPAGYRTSNVVVSDDFDDTLFISGLPEGAEVVYTTSDKNNFKSADELKADPNFKWSDIDAIEINSNIFNFKKPTAYLDAGKSIVLTIPITAKSSDEEHLQGVSEVHTEYNRMNSSHGRFGDTLNFRYSTIVTDSTDWNGASYHAVLSDGKGGFVAAPADAQALMPQYKDGDIDVDNVYGANTVDASDSPLTVGGTFTVHLNNLNIINALNKEGYSTNLNADGTQQNAYGYKIGSNFLNGATRSVPYLSVTVRQVINANDNTVKVGQNWTAADNLTSVEDNSNNVLTGNDAINAVKTTINDQDGVLQDGKIAKDGSFDVTYTYQLKDGTNISKTITVKTKSTTNHSGSNNSSSNSSSSSSNSSSTITDPVISPDSPDNINDVNRLVSTHPSDGVVSLYKLDTSKITNRSLNTASDWFSDKEMTFAGETYYRVASNEWVKASNVYVYQNKNIVVQTNSNLQLVDSKGNAVTNRSLLADTAWYSDRIAYINGKTYYRVATNEFVSTDAVTVL